MIDNKCKSCEMPVVTRQAKCSVWSDFLNDKIVYDFCESCGHVSIPQNFHDYATTEYFSESGVSYSKINRVGDERIPGREYYMGCLAIEAMFEAGMSCKNILIFGAGQSMDHKHLKKEYSEIDVKITDLKNFQQHENFIDITSASKFDVVIACEVIEHFLTPKEDFVLLLSKLNPKGLLICSTDIRKSHADNISKTTYPFMLGHTSYYTGKSLIGIIKFISDDYIIDFRAPEKLGTNKRYVLISKDNNCIQGVACYFSKFKYAPCEPSGKSLNPRKWANRLNRLLSKYFNLKGGL